MPPQSDKREYRKFALGQKAAIITDKKHLVKKISGRQASETNPRTGTHA